MPRAAAFARNAATHLSNGVSFARVALGSIAAANVPAMAAMHVRRAMLDGGFLALTSGLAFDLLRIVERLFRIGARPDNSIAGCRLAIGRGRSGCEHGVVDEAPAPTDEALVGGDQSHVGIDEDPAVAGRHLGVEVQVIGGAARLAAI